jgi:acyl-coenzyme A thioesterase PaaI-like protein
MKPVNTTGDHITLRANIQEIKRNIVLVEARLYNDKEESCTKALCTYFTFSQEKAAGMGFGFCKDATPYFIRK